MKLRENDMKKIAVVSYDDMPLPPVKGGAVENLIHFLVEDNEVEKKAELTVFSVYDREAKGESKRYRNTEFVYVKKRERLSRVTDFTNRVFKKLRFGAVFQIHPYLIDVAKIINQGDFDYVLVENRADYVPYLRKKVKAEILLHIHNDFLCKSYHLADKILKGCKKVFAVSEYIKNRVLTINGDEDQIAILRNVIDVDRFMNTAPEVRGRVRAMYDIQPWDVVFAYVGRITPGKGVKELIEAFIPVSEKYENVKLLIVGAKWFSSNAETPFMQELRELSARIEDKIIFTGYVDYGTIAEQYACADVVVVPSIMGEACGLVVLEGMSSGKALIVSDSGGIPENIEPEFAIEVARGESFVQDLTMAMKRLASDRELREAMGQSAKAHAHVHDKKQYLGKLLQLLEE